MHETFFYRFINGLEDEDETVKRCLITNEPLDNNSIELQCGHEFNYGSLYLEYANTIYANMTKLSHIYCPYCRMPLDNYIPFNSSIQLSSRVCVRDIEGITKCFTSYTNFLKNAKLIKNDSKMIMIDYKQQKAEEKQQLKKQKAEEKQQENINIKYKI